MYTVNVFHCVGYIVPKLSPYSTC